MTIANSIPPTGGTERGGSEAIDKYIFSHLPQECIDTRSTAGYRDLTEEEKKEMRVFVEQENKRMKDAKAAEVARNATNETNNGAQDSETLSARSSLTPTGDHTNAKTPGSEDVGPDVATVSEQPDNVSSITNTHPQTGHVQGLDNFGARPPNDEALPSHATDALATKISPVKVLKSQGRPSTSISIGDRNGRNSITSGATTNLATREFSTFESPKVVATNSNSNNPEDRAVGGDSALSLEHGKTYIIIDTDDKVARRFTAKVNERPAWYFQDLNAVCQEISGFTFSSPAPTRRRSSTVKASESVPLHGLEGVNIFVICLDDQTVTSRLQSENGPSTHHYQDVGTVLSKIRDLNTNQSIISQNLDSAPSMLPNSQADSSNVAGELPVLGALQENFTQTFPPRVYKEFPTALSASSDGLQQKASHSKTHHGQSHTESTLIMSDIRNESSGTTNPSAPSAQVLQPGSTDHTVTEQSLQEPKVVWKADLSVFGPPPTKPSLPKTAAKPSTVNQQQVLRDFTTVPSNDLSVSTAASKVVSYGKKRGSGQLMNPKNIAMAHAPASSTAENHDVNTQDSQSYHTHQSKKTRTQGPGLEPSAGAAKDLNTFKPVTMADLESTADATEHSTSRQSFTMADVDAFFADQDQMQRQKQYAKRDEMLQRMIDSKIPSIVAAAERNKNKPIDPDLHPAYCGIELTNEEAFEMDKKMMWLPLDFSYMPEY